MQAARLIAGALLHVPEPGLRVDSFTLAVQQKSAEGIVVPARNEVLNDGKEP